MSIGIIILNYNNFDDTRNCINSVLKHNTADVKFIIVDNASNSNIQNSIKCFLENTFSVLQIFSENETISSPLTQCSYITCSKNKGYAQGNNEGLNLAYQDNELDYVLILNNDILFTEDIIPKLQYKIIKDNKIGLIGPLLYDKNENIDYNCARKNVSLSDIFFTYSLLYIDFFKILSKRANKKLILKQEKNNSEHLIPIELPSGSCMLIKKELMQKIGGFDPNTFLYYEENILYKKLNELGYQNYIDKSISCIHLGGSSTNQAKSLFIIKCSSESMLYYLRNYTNASVLYISYISLLTKVLTLKVQISNALKSTK